MPQFDVVVVGLGVMGSAALYSLARRGFRVAGIERFAPGHDRGSSHGETRIIRLGYFEHPSYVPLLRRAYELWRELEAAAGRRLLHITGIVEIGPPGGELVTGTLAASRLHHLPHDVLDAAETMRRFPAFRLPVRLRRRVPARRRLRRGRAHHRGADRDGAAPPGAEVQTGVRVLSLTPHGNGVRVAHQPGRDRGRASPSSPPAPGSGR